MNFHVMTLFPEMIEQGVHTSITGKAIDKGTIGLNAVNIRDYTQDKHRHVDDYPYGGGAGMVMQPQPVYDCYRSVVDQIAEKSGSNCNKKPRVIYMTPQGRVFSQAIAEELSKEDDLIFLCGHYEGIDERVLEEIVTDNLSIGDYVLTGGELAAMVMIDAISRLVPGVLNNEESAQYESFQDGLLEYPQYTRPVEFHGKKVPDVLLTGNHGKIESWRREKSIERTYERRPELFETVELDKKDRQRFAYIKELKSMASIPVSKHCPSDKNIQWLCEEAAQMLVFTDGFSGNTEDYLKSSIETFTVDKADFMGTMEALEESRQFDSVFLGEALCHMFPKDAKKVLKTIVRHTRPGNRVYVNICPYIPEDKNPWPLIDKNVYDVDNRVLYNLPIDIWQKIIGPWFLVTQQTESDGSTSLLLTRKSL